MVLAFSMCLEFIVLRELIIFSGGKIKDVLCHLWAHLFAFTVIDDYFLMQRNTNPFRI